MCVGGSCLHTCRLASVSNSYGEQHCTSPTGPSTGTFSSRAYNSLAGEGTRHKHGVQQGPTELQPDAPAYAIPGAAAVLKRRARPCGWRPPRPHCSGDGISGNLLFSTLSFVMWLGQPLLDGVDGGLGPIPHLQFVEDDGQAVADGLIGQAEFLPDLFVTPSRCNPA